MQIFENLQESLQNRLLVLLTHLSARTGGVKGNKEEMVLPGDKSWGHWAAKGWGGGVQDKLRCAKGTRKPFGK
jgi:hypothetical protein